MLSNNKKLVVFLLIEEYVFLQFFPVLLKLLDLLLFFHQSPLEVIQFGLSLSLSFHHLSGEFPDLFIFLADFPCKFFIFIFQLGIL